LGRFQRDFLLNNVSISKGLDRIFAYAFEVAVAVAAAVTVTVLIKRKKK